MARAKTDLLQGTLDLLVLRVVSVGPSHGYAIAKRIRQSSRETLAVQQGSLYPALHRLEARGLIASEWGLTHTKRRARFYSITPRGRSFLEEETSYWRQFSAAIDLVLENG